MKIAVIIPVVQILYANTLLTRMMYNTKLPDQLILIDNSEYGCKFPVAVANALNLHYHRVPPKRIRPYFVPGWGTNEAWKYGLNKVHSDIDLVTVFNDDILINRHFFEILEKSFKKAGELYAMAIPQTVSKIETIYEYEPKIDVRYIPTKVRAGYAYTLRKSFLDHMIPIPDTLKIFYGDNWIMSMVHRANKRIMLMRNNKIYHHGGSTVSKLKHDMAKHTGKCFAKNTRRVEYDQYLREIRALRTRLRDKWREEKND
jgi:hypothetical protein